ncbi:GPI transamidase component PIG-S-like [Homarus americanus]|uniref:GPI transamidase component PIG-S-like n=1 Tax=Homarus americanus TaxID=6706 RepID=A0A8J5MTD6_HOMAM|nr:GPI transamidase component PIG-S-like [Homarus americanus]
MTKAKEVKTKMGGQEGAWAAAGFAVVLVLVGLPVWWYTTTVYRTQLPYSTIENLSGQLRYHAVGMKIVGVTKHMFADDLEKNLQSVQGVKFHISQRLPTKRELGLIKTVDSLAELDTEIPKEIYVASGTLALVVLHQEKLFGSNNVDVIVGRHRVVYIRQNVDLQLLAMVIKSMVVDPLAIKRAHGTKLLHQLPGQHKEAMRQVPTEPGYDVTLTLMVPEPHRTRIDWDVETAVNDYLAPVVKQLEQVTKLIVRSQVLYMTSLSVSPQWSASHEHYALPQDQLPLTINAIEANFLVPRWGGVMIHNIPPAEKNTTGTRHVTLDSHLVMTTALTHLYRLLPVPSVSLCELVGEISNMVISDEVGGWVWGAVEEWGEYAIYVPLFLPVSIPVILSLKMVMSLYWRSSGRKEKVE